MGKLLIITVSIICFILLCWYYSKYIIRYRLRCMAKDVIDTLNKYKIEYWVDFGTLLGIVREDDIILGDSDVDVVLVDSPTLHLKMAKAKGDFESKGYFFKREEWSAYRVYKKGLYTDMYINKRDDLNRIYIGSTGDTSNVSYDLIGVPVLMHWRKIDRYVKVPEHVHETLVFRYGEDYKTPKHGFKGRNP